MKIKIIVPVGKSLIEKYREDRLEKLKNKKCINLNLLNANDKTTLVNEICNILKGEENQLVANKTLDNKLNEFFSQFQNNAHQDRYPCAEIQSLLLLFEEFKRNKKNEIAIVFIPTTETDKLAEKIKSSLEKYQESIKTKYNFANFCFKFNVISGVNISANYSSDFLQGLSSLADKINKEISSKDYDEIYVNITGGYKGIVPITSLLGFVDEKIKVFYAHEESRTVIITPPLPVSWDIRRVDEIRGIIQQDKINGMVWNILPERCKFLYDQYNYYKRGAFGELIYNYYIENKTRRYGYGYYLIEQLDNNYKRIIKNKLPDWEHLWIGDQIPETVEHARGHSLRLLEMAYYLFKYYPELYKNIGESAGLYLLLCAIWLHDIGHSALEYKDDTNILPISLMPSLVREWHHFSSAQMIRDGNYIEDKEGKKLVALISEYHRKKMPLNNNNPINNPYSAGILTNKICPLEKVLSDNSIFNHFKGKINKDNVLLITALLRLLDACDVQADRVIDPSYKKMRKQRTDMEIEFCKKQLDNLDCSNNQKIKEFINKCEKNTFTQNGINKIEKDLKELVCSLAKEFKEALNGSDWNKLECVSLKNRIVFKAKQWVDFVKHSSVRFVYLKRETNILKAFLFAEKDSNQEILGMIENDIKGELSPIQGYLKGMGINNFEIEKKEI
ncbi:MAG: hypothetical protein AB1410_10105 [Acidobacteriota bacterium]